MMTFIDNNILIFFDRIGRHLQKNGWSYPDICFFSNIFARIIQLLIPIAYIREHINSKNPFDTNHIIISLFILILLFHNIYSRYDLVKNLYKKSKNSHPVTIRKIIMWEKISNIERYFFSQARKSIFLILIFTLFGLAIISNALKQSFSFLEIIVILYILSELVYIYFSAIKIFYPEGIENNLIEEFYPEGVT